MERRIAATRWKIGEVAERARVSVRALHHYDAIGLLVPSERSAAGYRLYTGADVERLFRILLYRELGLSLEAIAAVIDEPGHDLGSALRTHRERLVQARTQADAAIAAVDRLLESIESGDEMRDEEMLDAFDAFANAPDEVREQQATYGNEVRQRWGDTDAYRESMRRARRHTKAEWAEIREQGDANEARMAALLAAGADPAGAEAMDAAEAMRLHIDRWFYPCSHAMHAGLAEMYVTDPRFAAHYDYRAAGLAAFVAAAVRANAARAGG